MHRWQAFGAAFQYLAVRPWGRNLLLKYPGVFRQAVWQAPILFKVYGAGTGARGPHGGSCLPR